MTDHKPLDPYAVLGVPRRASQDQIGHAYRALARRHHPDTRAQADPAHAAASDTALRQALAAYAILGDPARRAAYNDRHPTIDPRPPRRSPASPVVVIDPRGTRYQPPPIQVGPVRWHR